MSELQSNQKIVRCSDVLTMSRLEDVPKLDQIGHRLLVDHQLIRIGSTVRSNGNSFTTPHQLRTAKPKVLPASTSQLCRTTISCAVPAFHRKNAPSIADFTTNRFERLIQRRDRAQFDGFVERQVQLEFIKSLTKLLRRFECEMRGNAMACFQMNSETK